MTQVLCVDFGSTFTKAVLVDLASGLPLATGSVPTTIDTDVLDGYRQIRARLAAQGLDGSAPVLACSSAGGGLRLAVVGYERTVTAEAGHRVGLSAGAKVVHVAAGALTTADVSSLRAARPDVVLLVGGTDGGNAEVLRHNADRLAKARVAVPVVVAGNVAVRDDVAATLRSTGRRFVLADNVLPEIGVIAPESARSAIREVFLRHVIGGKGLSRGPDLAAMVKAPTPDAMLRGIETLAAATDGDVLVLDIGGATTDVYSVITPQGEDADLRKDVVATLWHARTVEGDLGMRWNAGGVVEAAAAEHLLTTHDEQVLRPYADRVAGHPAHLPDGAQEQNLELRLATLAAQVAVRRHARAPHPGGSPRPLADVAHVIGSGGVLRHAAHEGARDVLRCVTTDFGGGWKVPERARTTVDMAYLLFAVGLLADTDPQAAQRLAGHVLGRLPAAPGCRRG